MKATDRKNLDDLSLGFRNRLLSYDELTKQVHAWARAFPKLCRVTSIGKTPEGRDLWLLTLGPDPDRARPSAWIDGNMHASELAGSSVALSVAEDVLRLHLSKDQPVDVSEPVAARLREVRFFVLPRMSPDGAEVVLTKGRYVRSIPRDERPARAHAYWRSEDVDGDGLVMAMRVVDDAGEMAEAKEFPGLLLPRTIDDPPPYYKVYPEGVIENFDGTNVPTPFFLSDNQTDLNRNFPYAWAPDSKQVGAGAFPLSEVESRAVVEFATKHPEIFLWLNLHTFGGVFIRPLGDKPDSKMDQEDLALYRQLGDWAEKMTGYPMVSGAEEFLYEPDTPLHGDLTDYAYYQRGAIAYVVELWDLFKQAGLEKKKKFVDNYSHLTREDMLKIAAWDRDKNGGNTIKPWRKFKHPQLGDVEVGGLDSRLGMWNPPLSELPNVCKTQAAHYLRTASLAPSVTVTIDEVVEVSPGLTRVTATVENRGYLPTFVLSSAKALSHNEPLWADVTCTKCELVDPALAHREIGHLDGWGRGLFDGSGALYYAYTRGTTGARTFKWTLRGKGSIDLKVGSCRVGWTSQKVNIG
ncbi:MAG TPA: M14 family metallopeptidase [Casimicrobiaceae bacterium]|nr:M14 family metallopeptidase [Casimicrobiaceae bacterium]